MHRYHIFESVRAGIHAATTELGCQGGTMEMATAIKQVLNRDTLVEAWLQGEPVFCDTAFQGSCSESRDAGEEWTCLRPKGQEGRRP
jgi:hypothetical protein